MKKSCMVFYFYMHAYGSAPKVIAFCLVAFRAPGAPLIVREKAHYVPKMQIPEPLA